MGPHADWSLVFQLLRNESADASPMSHSAGRKQSLTPPAATSAATPSYVAEYAPEAEPLTGESPAPKAAAAQNGGYANGSSSVKLDGDGGQLSSEEQARLDPKMNCLSATLCRRNGAGAETSASPNPACAQELDILKKENREMISTAWAEAAVEVRGTFHPRATDPSAVSNHSPLRSPSASFPLLRGLIATTLLDFLKAIHSTRVALP